MIKKKKNSLTALDNAFINGNLPCLSVFSFCIFTVLFASFINVLGQSAILSSCIQMNVLSAPQLFSLGIYIFNANFISSLFINIPC